jgi:tripartite-type tricarboxylate transporter receptor subunit TctC
MFHNKKIVTGMRNAVMLALGLATFALTAQAQTNSYPNKPLKFVVPFPAGSATDSVGRIIAQAMSEELKQPIAVENKAGSNGVIGADAVKSAVGDPYTLLVTTSTTQAAVVSLYKKLSFDPVKDFTPVGKIGQTGFILMVKPDFPAKDMREFVAYAKANPGKLNYGHGSSGSWVSAALMSEAAGINTVPIAYRGIPPALVDLLGGQIQFAFADVGNAMSQINGGAMRGLAITTAKRAGKAPNVPPIADTIKDYDISAWFALMAPAGIPADASKKLNDTLQTVLAKPAVREKLANAGIDMDVQDSAALARTIDAEIKKWAVWVKVAGITPE